MHVSFEGNMDIVILFYQMVLAARYISSLSKCEKPTHDCSHLSLPDLVQIVFDQILTRLPLNESDTGVVNPNICSNIV